MRLVGEPVDAAVLAPVAGDLPAGTRFADFVARTGPGRLVHVEFTRGADAELPLRMLEYRARLMRRADLRELSLAQHVIVLGPAGVVPEGVQDGAALRFRFPVHYVRDHDPAEFLVGPELAPLAPLARAGSGAERAAALRAGLRLIRAVPDRGRVVLLATVAVTLASAVIDPGSIERVRRELGMPVNLEDFPLLREAERRGEQRGRQLGEQRAILAVLRSRFGDHPGLDDLAARLTARHPDDFMDLVAVAPTVADLDQRLA